MWVQRWQVQVQGKGVGGGWSWTSVMGVSRFVREEEKGSGRDKIMGGGPSTWEETGESVSSEKEEWGFEEREGSMGIERESVGFGKLVSSRC